MAKIHKYNKSAIDHAISVKVSSNKTSYYPIVSTDDVLNTSNNDTVFPELTRVFEEYFYIKVQEVSVLKYPNL